MQYLGLQRSQSPRFGHMVDIATFVRPFFFRFMSAFGKIRKEIEEKKAREEQAQEEADSTDAEQV